MYLYLHVYLYLYLCLCLYLYPLQLCPIDAVSCASDYAACVYISTRIFDYFLSVSVGVCLYGIWPRVLRDFLIVCIPENTNLLYYASTSEPNA